MKNIIKQLDSDPKFQWIKQEIINNERKWGQLYTHCAYLLCKRFTKLTYLKEQSIKEAAKLLIPYYKKALSDGHVFDYFYKAHVALVLSASENKPDLNCFCFLGGWLLLQENSSRLTPLVFGLIERCVKGEQEINMNNLVGDFLRTLPNFPEATRLRAGHRFPETHSKRPIHEKRWEYLNQDINGELSHRAEISGTSPLQGLPGYPRNDPEPLIGKTRKELVGLSILGSIFEAPLIKCFVKYVDGKLQNISLRKRKREDGYDEIQLWDIPLNGLIQKPQILKQAMSRLMSDDLAPKWKHRGREIMPFAEEFEDKERKPEEPLGELELAALVIEKIIHKEWEDNEINDINWAVILENKLQSIDLSPRERTRIHAKLSGTQIKGTPGSIKTAISRMKGKFAGKIKKS